MATMFNYRESQRYDSRGEPISLDEVVADYDEYLDDEYPAFSVEDQTYSASFAFKSADIHTYNDKLGEYINGHTWSRDSGMNGYSTERLYFESPEDAKYWGSLSIE